MSEPMIKREGEMPDGTGRMLFVCVLSTTDTAKIPGISAAGSVPEITDYTPAGDAELVTIGRPVSVPDLPMTPSGCPTPALITRAAVHLTETPTLFVDSGLRIRPCVPTLNMNAQPGRDIRSGSAVNGVEQIYENAVRVGQMLSGFADTIVIGESIPGGTTTALGVLRAMGYDARVSSSFPVNPLELKHRVVEEGMRAARTGFGDFRNEPFRAVAHLGDPMMPTVSGIAAGIAEGGAEYILAGGTQMLAVAAVMRGMNMDLDNIPIATTKYIVEDGTSNFTDMAEELGCRTYSADPGFDNSRVHQLAGYERGEVKEGVGAGGAVLLAAVKGISQDILRCEIEETYLRLNDEG